MYLLNRPHGGGSRATLPTTSKLFALLTLTSLSQPEQASFLRASKPLNYSILTVATDRLASVTPVPSLTTCTVSNSLLLQS